LLVNAFIHLVVLVSYSQASSAVEIFRTCEAASNTRQCVLQKISSVPELKNEFNERLAALKDVGTGRNITRGCQVPFYSFLKEGSNYTLYACRTENDCYKTGAEIGLLFEGAIVDQMRSENSKEVKIFGRVIGVAPYLNAIEMSCTDPKQVGHKAFVQTLGFDFPSDPEYANNGARRTDADGKVFVQKYFYISAPHSVLSQRFGSLLTGRGSAWIKFEKSTKDRIFEHALIAEYEKRFKALKKGRFNFTLFSEKGEYCADSYKQQNTVFPGMNIFETFLTQKHDDSKNLANSIGSALKGLGNDLGGTLGYIFGGFVTR